MKTYSVPALFAGVMLATIAPAAAGVNDDVALCRGVVEASPEINSADYHVKFRRFMGGSVRVVRFQLRPTGSGAEPLKALCTLEGGAVAGLTFISAR